MSVRRDLLSAGAGLLLAVTVALVTASLVVLLLGDHQFAFDFNGWYWPAGQRVLHGASPYGVPLEKAFDYPAPAALAFAVWALLPRMLAGALFTALTLAAVPLTLWLMGVRDRRVYAVALLWPAVVFGWETANVTLLLVAGTAAIWRYRDRPLVVGCLLAAIVSVKPLFAPFAVWLLATGRYRALVAAVGATLALNAVAWPVLGLGQLSRYVALMGRFDHSAQERGYSLIALLLHCGAGPTLAYAVALGAAGAVALLAWRAGRRGDERGALLAAVVVVLLASPLVESHYLALLLVPLALARPTLSGAWGLGLMMWIGPVDHPANAQRAIVIGLAALLVCVIARPGRSLDLRLGRSGGWWRARRRLSSLGSL